MHTNSDEKVFYMKNHLLEKLHPNLTGGNPVKHFQNPQKPNRKKITGLLRSREKNRKKFKQWANCGQTMVKLLIQEILVLLNNYCFLEQ